METMIAAADGRATNTGPLATLVWLDSDSFQKQKRLFRFSSRHAELQREVLGPDTCGGAVEDGDGTFEGEAGFAGVTGVEEEDAIDGFAERFVAVAENDDVGAFARE